jgi:hypothetical protein
MRHVLAMIALLALTVPAQAQFRNRGNLDRLNRRLCGRLVDYTHNHGQDRRIFSPILGMPRDLYVYLPPSYDPRLAYPLIIYMHMAYVDEHTLSGSNRILELDRMIVRGEFPPAIVAVPDGTYSGENRLREPHSLFVNGCGGRVEDHILFEVIPFLLRCYSIRPEREAHALLGVSAGGFGAMAMAIKHRDFFAVVATLAGPLNLRYSTCHGDYLEDFDPATYRWNDRYNPDQVVGTFYLGLRRVPEKKYVEPVFGCFSDVVAAIRANNPADLLFSTDLHPGELAIYASYPMRDNWNFDAQNQSFQWLASQRGIQVDLVGVPGARHSLAYFRSNHLPAYQWLSQHLLPPAARNPSP